MVPADPKRSAAKTRLARRRLGTGITQAQLAERAGIGLRSLQRLERGEAPDASVRVVLALARELDCDVDDLIEDHWRR